MEAAHKMNYEHHLKTASWMLPDTLQEAKEPWGHSQLQEKVSSCPSVCRYLTHNKRILPYHVNFKEEVKILSESFTQ